MTTWWHQVQGKLEDGTWELIDRNLDAVSAAEAIIRYERSKAYGYNSGAQYVDFRVVHESSAEALPH